MNRERWRDALREVARMAAIVTLGIVAFYCVAILAVVGVVVLTLPIWIWWVV